MDAAVQLRQDFASAHGFLEGTLGEISNADATAPGPGATNSIAANYAHALFGEDGVVNGMVAGRAPLFATTFAGKAGASEPPPQGPAWGEWAKSATFDIAKLRAYGQAVYAATDAYLATAKGSDLERMLDMPGDQYSVSRFLGIMVGNAWMHCGEISCLKGIRGQKGYPM